MSRLQFPDIIGPSYVAANGGTPVLVRAGKLNIISTAAAASDNPGKRQTDLSLTGALFSTVTASVSASGEWQPTITNLSSADMVRVSASVAGAILTGMDGTTPTRLVKYVTNIGTVNAITIQPPASIVAGHAYFVNTTPYILLPNETVRATWDAVSLVYRLKAYTGPARSYIVVNTVHVAVNANRLYQ